MCSMSKRETSFDHVIISAGVLQFISVTPLLYEVNIKVTTIIFESFANLSQIKLLNEPWNNLCSATCLDKTSWWHCLKIIFTSLFTMMQTTYDFLPHPSLSTTSTMNARMRDFLLLWLLIFFNINLTLILLEFKLF